jgi:hypothetical protein
MASTTILTFPSNLPNQQVPTFVGNGSKLEHPDLQMVFWGPNFPANGPLSVGSVMQAVNSIVTGPYMEGMKQYGYIGPVNVRQPIVNTGNPNINYPGLGLNVSQEPSVMNAVQGLVDNMVSNDTMGDVSSNHDLIVMVVIDPTIRFPQNEDGVGNITTVLGAHAKYEKPRFLAPAIRFSQGFVCTQPFGKLSAFDQFTATFSHELVESISNPFNGSGWVQTVPAPVGGAGEIGDVCNNLSCVVDGIAVQPYWGVQQAACILPTETRQTFLTQRLTKHVNTDSPKEFAQVDLGPLCGSGNFDYVERSWDNAVTLTATHTGYEVPLFQWSINNVVVPAGNSTVTVACTWQAPTKPGPFSQQFVDVASDHLPSVFAAGAGGGGVAVPAQMKVEDAGAGEPVAVADPALLADPAAAGDPAVVADPAVAASPVADGQSGFVTQNANVAALRRSRVQHNKPSAPAGALQDSGLFKDVITEKGRQFGGVFKDAPQLNFAVPTANRPRTATIRVTAFSSVLVVECGPGEGNNFFDVECQVVENWEGIPGTTMTTLKKSSTTVSMDVQEILWGTAFQQANSDCEKKRHLAAGGGVNPGIPHDPGGPVENQVNEAERLRQIRQAGGVQQVNEVNQGRGVNRIKELNNLK